VVGQAVNYADRAHVRSLQARAVCQPGEMAAWIAPPTKGINGRPGNFEYARAEA
jgi:benzoyl-CoA 2,3-epoxidase subunit B